MHNSKRKYKITATKKKLMAKTVAKPQRKDEKYKIMATNIKMTAKYSGKGKVRNTK